ncbi:MAG: hypothetical protein HY077_08300 [Elusimicrobia bacterium]|nr:hypothetical protein [Elusimicrobiota bacterium]
MKASWSLTALLVLLSPGPGFCWGERGHNAIARVAAMRLDDPALRGFFQAKALQLGHLANIPDTSWRKLGPEVEALNAPTHFLNADEWTDDIASLPLDYSQAKKSVDGLKSRADAKPIDLFESGTVIWRAEQLFERMTDSFKKAKSEEPGSKGFKAAVQQALVYGGLMAHFVGDASQPYHNTADHDGYGTGEGGIHSFFESAVLNVETPALELDVFETLPTAAAALDCDRMMDDGAECRRLAGACVTRELSARALARVGEVRRADAPLVLEPSVGKKAAKRKSADEAAPAFRPIIEWQLALAAGALRWLWREAWQRGGRPDLSKAQTFDYALAPDFVEPDYDPQAVARASAARGAPRK